MVFSDPQYVKEVSHFQKSSINLSKVDRTDSLKFIINFTVSIPRTKGKQSTTTGTDTGTLVL